MVMRRSTTFMITTMTAIKMTEGKAMMITT